jgi:hypothetical protein
MRPIFNVSVSVAGAYSVEQVNGRRRMLADQQSRITLRKGHELLA